MPINSDIQQQVFDLLSKASNLSFVSTDRAAGASIGLILSPGQRVTAEVLTTLANNRAQVQVGSERFNMDLPMPVRVGQNLEMTFVSADPRATFAITRQGMSTPPVTLSDASRLLGLMVGDEQSVDPALRTSLQSVSSMLRNTSGEAGVLANLLDEVLVYSPPGQPEKTLLPGDHTAPYQRQSTNLTADQARVAAFESNAAQILRHIASSSRSLLVEAASQPLTALPLMPGQEVDASVLGRLSGNRVVVSVAGTPLELIIPRNVQAGDILRLTFISSQPKPLFAIARSLPEATPGSLSEAGRWLSVLEHNQGGVSNQQMFVLERLNMVLKNLPADSPAFAAIKDEAGTYESILQNRLSLEHSSGAGAATIAVQQNTQQGNGIILSDDMAKLLQALIKGNRLALLEALNQQAVSTGLLPGQQIKGEVLAALGGGRFMLQVAGQAMEFSMPKGTSRGDRVNLFFISDAPLPTFLLVRFGRAGEARVSDTSRWLSGFLVATAEQLPAQATLGVLRTLLGEPPLDSTLVGRMLQQGLRESGLFYESHLERWFSGDFPLKDILQEPQGRLSHLKQLAQIPQPTPLLMEDLARATLKTGSLEVMEAMVTRAGAEQNQGGSVDPRILPVIHEQLATLQNGQVVYRGDLFPGQPMEWAVSERESRRNKEGGRERSWDTSLRIELPMLGEVSARLKLDGKRVSIDFGVGELSSAGVLDTGKARLIEQLQAAGLTPEKIGVQHEAPQ
jgi:hypothetical protein